MRTIEIDFDIHKRIETERRSFEETPNAVLRRLLGLPEAAEATPRRSGTGAGFAGWTDSDVALPNGTLVRMSYNKQTYQGEIADGRWRINGQSFTSPSGAATGVAVTKKGTKPSLDGWIYWEVKRPGDDEWVKLHSLRPSDADYEARKAVTLEDLGL